MVIWSRKKSPGPEIRHKKTEKNVSDPEIGKLTVTRQKQIRRLSLTGASFTGASA